MIRPAGTSTSDVRVMMQPASSGWSSNLVRVGAGGGGERVLVVAHRPTSKWITSRMVAVPSRSIKHCCSPRPSGVPGDLEAACRGGGQQKRTLGRLDHRPHCLG